MIKKIFSISLLVIIGAALSGCETYGPNAKKGTVIGAGSGALLGAMIGHQSDEAGEGALLGAVTGATVGGFRGINKDRKVGVLHKEARDRLLNDHHSVTIWHSHF